MSSQSNLATKGRLLRLALSERGDPEPYYRALAAETVRDLPFAVAGDRVLDLGYGTGHNADALSAAGAEVVGIDMERGDFTPTAPLITGDALALPVRAATFDGVFSSNMLEHTPDPAVVFAEIERVLVPGGWAWISFTNWYSPWGGHNITPFHYLGAERGLALWRRMFGEPKGNLPGIGLFPTHIRDVLTLLDEWPTLEVDDVYPRYYPSQRWVLRTGPLSEILTWNCVIVLRKK